MKSFSPATFSSLRINADEEKKFKEWWNNLKADTDEIVGNLCGSGFKVSVSWVVDQNSFCVSLIGTDATKKHKGMVLTSWSDELAEAVAMCAYKHYEMCGEDAWPVTEQGKRWG